MNIPVIILKNLIILPNQEIKLELSNAISQKSIAVATNKYNNEILVIAPIDTFEEEPGVDDLPKVGVIAKVKSRIVINDGIQVVLRGIKRVAVTKYYNSNDDILYSEIMHIDLPAVVKDEESAIKRKLIAVLKEYIDNSNHLSNDVLGLLQDKDLNKTTDIIASFLPFDVNKKLRYMQEINPLKRAKTLIIDLSEEIKIIELDNELDEKVNISFNEDQRKFILREKVKIINEELGEESISNSEINRFKELLSKLRISSKTKEKIEREIKKLEFMNESSPEFSVIRNYLDYLLNLPWNKSTKENANFNQVRESLDKTHYGLDEIKSRITEYVAIKNINKDINPPIICLVGPPGVGKTSIASSIAAALNRKFYKISVGGLNDATELIGSRKTYLASSPGKIIGGINKVGSNNPVILIDEVDKMVKDYKGDPASVLLEILDPVQNKKFVDNYLEEPFDLSNVLFILTANNEEDIPYALVDRVELININSYTLFEKKDIARKYLLPKICEEHKLVEKERFSDDIILFIINNYTNEAGVRELTRVLTSLVRKMAINNIKTINKDKIIKLLGNPKYSNDTQKEDSIGVASALAYTPVGGIVTTVQVITYPGSGKIITTGNLGKIMQESIEVITTVVKSKYKHNLSKMDIHFHYLSADTKKDGPSAGLASIVALLSVLEKKKIPSDIAFTGEISLNGNILKIGGLKEKLIGAYNNGIKTVYIPASNEMDLVYLPDVIKENMEINLTSNIDEIYTKLFK
ncbi:MAG TPA: endopeptidase La [Candidatus Onthocola stercorigallinarum]|nr:endopeptidase La [Candidatus Onthocola stercorigallinarum]